jgi:hypothetical protein
MEVAAAWKHKSVSSIVIDNGEFKVAVKRRGDNRRPFHLQII